MANLRFRTATLADAQIAANLVNSAYRGESSKVGWTTEAHLLGGQRVDAEKIREMIQEEGVRLELLFDSRNSLVGTVYLRFEAPETCYLGLLTVDPVVQAQGLGKQILIHSEAIAREWGCTQIRITVIPSRGELVAFYERRGFIRTGNHEPFPEADPRFGIPKVEGLRLDEWIKVFRP